MVKFRSITETGFVNAFSSSKPIDTDGFYNGDVWCQVLLKSRFKTKMNGEVMPSVKFFRLSELCEHCGGNTKHWVRDEFLYDEYPVVPTKALLAEMKKGMVGGTKKMFSIYNTSTETVETRPFLVVFKKVGDGPALYRTYGHREKMLLDCLSAIHVGNTDGIPPVAN